MAYSYTNDIPPHPPQAETVGLGTFFPHEGSKRDNCHEDGVLRSSIRGTLHISLARFFREGATRIVSYEIVDTSERGLRQTR